MIVKKKHELMKPWYGTRTQLITFLLISVTIILAVILGMVTYMVSNIYVADSKRLMTLHQIEYANKMATIGRMAASVAINLSWQSAGHGVDLARQGIQHAVSAVFPR